MAVKFIIDSAADVTPAECEKLGVTHLPLTVCFGDQAYADGVELSYEAFYQKLATDSNHPTTSQVSPAAFEEACARLTANGDEVVIITISSKLSGTCQSAIIGSEEFEGKVFVVDSLSATGGERLLLMLGLRLAEQGMTAAQIARKLDEEKSRIRVYATLDTLEYLKRGGRISAATAMVGGLLNFKPAISVEGGLVVSAGKARGNKGANTLLRQLVEGTRGIDRDMPMYLIYSGASDENLSRFMAENSDLWSGCPEPVSTGCVGCVIGAHVGPGAVGVLYFERQEA